MREMSCAHKRGASRVTNPKAYRCFSFRRRRRCQTVTHWVLISCYYVNNKQSNISTGKLKLEFQKQTIER